MLPPASVLTNKKQGASRAFLSAVLIASVLGSSCAPPGPRALLKGQRLLQQGRYPEAIERLQAAAKLLPRNAQAWNYLGLAYHGANQPSLAERAYRYALELDRSLNAARFNLGCLYLEQTNLPAATRELTSYTLAESTSAEGWLRLGTAQLRARQFQEAERSFKTVLGLRENDPEALNALGVMQAQLRRPLDSLAYFNQALVQDTNYAPALLNSAIVLQQHLHNRLAALQRYRQYAALTPSPADSDSVALIIRQLEDEVALPLRPATNVVRAPAPTPGPPTGSLATVAAELPPSRSAAESTPPPARASSTNVPAQNLTAGKTQAEASQVSRPAPIAPPVEVTRVAEDLPIKPAEDVGPAAPGAEDPSSKSKLFTSTPASGSENSAKRGFLQKINPFAGRSAKTSRSDAVKAAEPSPEPFRQPAVDTNDSDPAPIPGRRYKYLAIERPGGGNRAAAEAGFVRGMRAQQRGLNAQAVNEYEGAIQADPAYFEAYYNLALAASDLGDLSAALKAYQYALAIRPNSADAGYNFALALKQANYPQDAAHELEKLLRTYSHDARARLSLANLYAQQLKQPKRAREHYLKVLELEPRHPEAARIRYWLVSNP